jgi:hypothetical protein
MMCKVSCRVAVAGMGDDAMDGICPISVYPYESFPLWHAWLVQRVAAYSYSARITR